MPNPVRRLLACVALAIVGYFVVSLVATLAQLANAAELVTVPLRARRGTRLRAVRLPGFRAEWLWHKSIAGPDDPDGGAILYFHGGAFVAGGLHSHRRLTGRITRAAGVPLLNVDYRQLPAAHFTGTVADALHSYEHLLGLGFAPEKIVFAGDSAGGGLTFATALAARERGVPMPGGIGAIAGSGIAVATADFGYWLGEPFWGQGLATAAARSMCAPPMHPPSAPQKGKRHERHRHALQARLPARLFWCHARQRRQRHRPLAQPPRRHPG